MNGDQVARRIYFGLREQGLTVDFNCAFDELPRDYKAQLQAVADSIPFPDPYEKLFEFADRSREIGHYPVEPLFNAFMEFKGKVRGD